MMDVKEMLHKFDDIRKGGPGSGPHAAAWT